MSILLENITIIPMNGENSLIEKGYIISEGQFIKAIGEGEAPRGNYEKVIDGSDRVVLPGFINTHTHAAMTLLRSYADDLPLMEWLETKIWPLEAKLTAEDVYWGTMLAIIEMIKSGTTTFVDMYFFMDEAARAVEGSGMRALLSRGMVGVGPENEKAIVESRELVSKWHGAAGGRVMFCLGPHAPYTCPPDYMARVLQLAAELKTGINIHVAETRGEFDDMMKLYGKTPVAHLESLGVFEHPVIAAHCVHVTAEDIAILRKHNVAVVHNPESNMKLASGIAPVPAMLKAGIPVALGTDGASSNNNLDMLQEMRTGAYLHKVNTMDPTVLPAYQALEMATVNGAISLGLGQELGRLLPGMKADMIIMSLKQAHMTPRYDILANIVYAAQAGDVETVIIDGRIIMEDHIIKSFDEEQVLALSRSIAERLVKG